MNLKLMGLTASAAILSIATGAFAGAQLDHGQTGGNAKSTAIILAQASGSGSGSGSGSAGSTGGPAATEPAEKTIGGTRKNDTETPAPEAEPGATDTTGKDGTAVDASQSKRKDTMEPAQSGSK